MPTENGVTSSFCAARIAPGTKLLSEKLATASRQYEAEKHRNMMSAPVANSQNVAETTDLPAASHVSPRSMWANKDASAYPHFDMSCCKMQRDGPYQLRKGLQLISIDE